MKKKDWIKDIHEQMMNNHNEIIAVRLKTAMPDQVMPLDDALLTGWLEGNYDSESIKKESWQKFKAILEQGNARWENPEKTSEGN
jgi:hypothetical protein